MLGAWAIFLFNRLIRQRNRLREAWSGIDVQLKRRHDLIPNLIESVKGYRAHEQSLFESLARNRAQAQAAQGVPNTGSAESVVSQNLRSLFVLAEAYPELKADQNFRQLSANLVETEDQLQYARRYYNGTVRDFNTMVESFPGLLMARPMGFQSAEFFEVETATERKAPEVKL